MLPNWGFRSNVVATHAAETVDLPCKSYQSDDSTIKFSQLVKEYVPEFTDSYKFNVHPLLFSGTLQTLYLSKADYSKSYLVHYGREILTFPEAPEDVPHLKAGQTTADYLMDPLESTKAEFKARCEETLPKGYPKLHAGIRYLTEDESANLHKQWDANDKPIIVIQHGLAGGSHEPAIRAVAEQLKKKGLNVVCLNSRGCCRSPITTPQIFSAVHTDDLRYFISELHKKYPSKQIHLLGFSFGGLILANYLAEEGDKSIVASAVTVSSPWDLYDSDRHLNASLSGRLIFSKAITFFLTNLVKVNIEVLKKTPLFSEEEFYENRKKFVKPKDFDSVYTCKTVGFPTADLYYRIASPIQRILDIKTPMLILNSADDPVISTRFPYKEVEANPYLYMATSNFGGHIAFTKPDGDIWYSDIIARYFDAFSKEIDNHSRPVTDYQGYKTMFSYKLPF